MSNSAEPKSRHSGTSADALSRWRAAAQRLGLGESGERAGAILLAAEIDDDERRLLLGDHASRIAPRRADVLAALGKTYDQQTALAGLGSLEARGVAAPLRQYAGPWIAAELELDARVRGYCIGAGAAAQRPLAGIELLPRVEAALESIAAQARAEPRQILVVIRGRPGSGRDTVLLALMGRLAAHPLVRSVFELRQAPDPLEPELSGSVAVWDARRGDPGPDDYDIARRWLRRSAHVAVAVLDRHQDAPDVDERLVLRVDVDPMSMQERCWAWDAALREFVPPATRAQVSESLSRRSQAGPGLARRVVRLGHLSEQRGATSELEARLCDAVQPSALRGILVERPNVPLGRVVGPSYLTEALDRLVLLCESAALIDAAGRSGVKALFAGPSGTGKTLAARAVASSVGRPLYRVDLAAVVSKWVGETEKNLRDAMVAAESAGAVLLFDEGDALFGKRGEVAKGTDRYANIEVAYLLQAVESFDGIVVVTTNLRNNIDEAFARRFDVTIEFLPPDRAQRETIWRQELGAAGDSLASDHLAHLARRADLHGGSIASASRVARVLALRRGDALVNAEDLRVAVQAEFLKIGSTVQAANWAVNATNGQSPRSRRPTRR